MRSGPGRAGTARVGTVTEQRLRFAWRAVCTAACAFVASAATAQSPESLGMSGPRFEPSRRAVLEEDWARRLAKALALEEGLPAEAKPEDYYGLLCPEQALRDLG